MTADMIEQGLAAHGVALFAEPDPREPRPDPSELIRACVESGVPRYRVAVIALLLALDEESSRRAAREAMSGLAPADRRWLRWFILAAGYLAEVYRSELAFLLGRPATAPAGLVDRGSLPPDGAMFGELGLRALADEIAAQEGAEVDWEGSLEGVVRAFIDRLWFERTRPRRAQAG